MAALRQYWLILLVWALVSLALVIQSWTQITTLSGWDPDDQLRMVQLRDFLGGQSWFDTMQYRMNSPEGAPMHWSRLIELPLALLVMALKPLCGQHVAEMFAGASVPLMLLGAIAYMLGKIATRLSNAEAGFIAVVLTLFSPALLMQLRPMRIDHHGWQIFCGVLALSTMFWPDKRRGGLVLGLSLAVWLHISLEGAPLTAAFFLLLGWRWIIEKANGRRLAWAILAFAGSSILLFLGTQRDLLGVHCDAISPPHIAAIILAAAIMVPAIAASPDHRRFRLAASLVAGAAAVSAIFLIAPACAGGAFGGLDPLVREYWYVNVSEGLPIWDQSLRTALVLIATSFCGIAALLMVRSKSSLGVNKDILIAGFFLVYAALLSLFVFRTVSVAAAFSIPLIAVWINQLFQQYRRSKLPANRVGLVALMLLLLVPGHLLAQLYSTGERAFGPAPKLTSVTAEANSKKCEAVPSVSALNALPNGHFVAPFDMGPTILLTTPHQVLASSHHRNASAMHDHIEIFRSVPNKARDIVTKRGITYIATCPSEAEMQLYARKNPGGLWDRLSRGDAPAWLEPLPDMGEGIKVWRVR